MGLTTPFCHDSHNLIDFNFNVTLLQWFQLCNEGNSHPHLWGRGGHQCGGPHGQPTLLSSTCVEITVLLSMPNRVLFHSCFTQEVCTYTPTHSESSYLPCVPVVYYKSHNATVMTRYYKCTRNRQTKEQDES